jgi:hypothetical protein
MKLTKRFIALAMTLVMSVTMLPLTALAKTNSGYETDLSYLEEKIADYETAMAAMKSSTTIYKNMKAAYIAYDKACRYRDAVRYGTTSSSQITAFADDLATKTNAMKNNKYSVPATYEGLTKAQMGFSSGSSASATYTKNMISPIVFSNLSTLTDGEKENANAGVGGSSFVWLWQGSDKTYTAPIAGGIIMTDTFWLNAFRYFSIYVNGGDISLGTDWKYKKNTFWNNSSPFAVASGGGWYYEDSSSDGTVTKTKNTGDSGTQVNNDNMSKNVFHGLTNYINYTNTAPFTQKTSDTDIKNLTAANYYTSTTPSFRTNIRREFKSFWSNSTYDLAISYNKPIYVINYVNVKNVLFNSTRLTKLSTIYNNDYATATAFLDAYDTLTSYNYKMTGTISASTVSTKASDIKSKVDTLINTTSALTTKASLSTLMSTIATKSGDSYSKTNYTSKFEGENVATDSAITDPATDNSKYTTTSWNNFINAYEAVQTYFNNLYDGGAYPTSLTNVTPLRTALVNAYNSLVLVAEFSPINKAIADVDTTYSTKNYDENNNQIYTYSTWTAFADSVNTGLTAKQDDVSDIAKFVVSNNTVTSTQTDYQNGIDSKAQTIRDKETALVEVNNDSYEAYESAKQIIESELTHTEKYTQDTIDSIRQALTSKDAEAYHILTATEAAAYSSSTGKSFAENDKVKDSVNVDAQITSLLTTVNELANGEGSYRTYNISFTAEKDGEQIIEQSATVPYGTVYTFDLGNNFDEDNNTVIWSSTTNDGTAVTGSNKMNGRGTIEKLIDTNIAVHAKITGYAESNLYTYKIYNGNGRLVAIEHHETADVKAFTDAEALVAIPFYTFSSWYIEVDENTKTVTVKAAYEAGDPIHVTAVSGTITDDKNADKGASADLVYDRETKVAYTGSNTFYAWAVKVGSKYTVVSYNSTYTFYSHTALDFVPIIKDGDTYKFETADDNLAVTADTIASSSVNTFGLTADEYVKTKLDNKAPFIAVVGTKILDNAKTRGFAMVTEGCTTPYSGVGMKFSKAGVDPADEAPKAIASVLSTGQFSVTLSGTTVGKFRATVNYDFPYTQGGGTAHLDVMDVSDLA